LPRIRRASSAGRIAANAWRHRARRRGYRAAGGSCRPFGAVTGRLEQALALVELGAAVRRAGRRADAREPLRKALELARVCGAEAVAARAPTMSSSPPVPALAETPPRAAATSPPRNCASRAWPRSSRTTSPPLREAAAGGRLDPGGDMADVSEQRRSHVSGFLLGGKVFVTGGGAYSPRAHPISIPRAASRAQASSAPALRASPGRRLSPTSTRPFCPPTSTEPETETTRPSRA
jgi:hypothetical protein